MTGDDDNYRIPTTMIWIVLFSGILGKSSFENLEKISTDQEQCVMAKISKWIGSAINEYIAVAMFFNPDKA